MAAYKQKKFLEYYEFKDKPEIVPICFYKSYKSYEHILKNVKKDVKKGMRVRSAVIKNARISKYSYYRWLNAAKKEIADGKTDTPLIHLFETAATADACLEEDIVGMGMDIARNGDGSMVQFLLKNRLEFKGTSKKEVEVSTQDNSPIKFEIVNMTPTETDK